MDGMSSCGKDCIVGRNKWWHSNCSICKHNNSLQYEGLKWQGDRVLSIDLTFDDIHQLLCHRSCHQPDSISIMEARLASRGKHSGNGKYKGSFAFTLTKSPEDDLSEADMLEAVRKIMSQTSCPVKKYAWYLEYKENGSHPHIHGIYETESGGRIEAKHFKRYWPIWDEKFSLGRGFRGGYHRPVRNDEKYEQYISKDGGLSESKNIGQ